MDGLSDPTCIICALALGLLIAVLGAPTFGCGQRYHWPNSAGSETLMGLRYVVSRKFIWAVCDDASRPATIDSTCRMANGTLCFIGSDFDRDVVDGVEAA